MEMETYREDQVISSRYWEERSPNDTHVKAWNSRLQQTKSQTPVVVASAYQMHPDDLPSNKTAVRTTNGLTSYHTAVATGNWENVPSDLIESAQHFAFLETEEASPVDIDRDMSIYGECRKVLGYPCFGYGGSTKAVTIAVKCSYATYMNHQGASPGFEIFEGCHYDYAVVDGVLHCGGNKSCQCNEQDYSDSLNDQPSSTNRVF